MSNEDERIQEIGDEEQIREEESGGEDGESDSSTENEEIEVEEMDEEDESDSRAGNNEKEVSEEEGEESYPNKRIKEDSIDRLSALPDGILIHILDEVMDMKTVATTCVLSKRWEHLWTQLTSICFGESSKEIEKTREFVSWVHRAIALRTINYLDDLVIQLEYKKCFASDINTWVQFAVRNKVKTLQLDLNSDVLDFFDMLPQSIYSCSSLTKLTMKRCIVAPLIRVVDWGHMTELSISEVELHDHDIQKILSGCPVLVSLELLDCWGFERLEVNSKSLDEIVITECTDDVEGYTVPLLEISAPFLRSLTIESFPMGRKKLRLTNVPSLITADIHFDTVDSDDFTVIEMDDTMRFFEDIKHVEELILICPHFEVLSKLAENGWQLPKSTRKRLTVESNKEENTISGIVVLLESSPNLESLTIKCDDEYEEPDKPWGPVAKDDLDCDLLRLKTVCLQDCANPYLNGEPMLTMARILFKRATALEEMVVDAFGNLNDFSSSFLEISQKLFSFPRSSQKAVLDLHQ